MMLSQYSTFNFLSLRTSRNPVNGAATSFRHQVFWGRKRTHKPIEASSPISNRTHEKDPSFHESKVLPFTKGKPLVGYKADGPGSQKWHLGWLSFSEWKSLMEDYESESGGAWNEEFLVRLGDGEGKIYWAINVTEDSDLIRQWLRAKNLSCVDLKTLMVATDFSGDGDAARELAVAGHGRALLEWHATAQFCGHCGAKTASIDYGRRRQCSNKACKKKTYPRVDPIVIMLVIDEENDRALLSRQSRYVPRKWTCLAGFVEPGESLEEAVRREAREETGVEVGRVAYHGSQAWPVGRSGGTVTCQLMVGFFAYAETLEIVVDEEELESARWHSRDDVRRALALSGYGEARERAAGEIERACGGGVEGESVESGGGEVAPMFVPGPHAIAHHLISCWANGE